MPEITIKLMKQILGLDLGTNSIGWALINAEENKIIKAGSRIIPMDAATMGDYEKGNLKSAASERTSFRGVRRVHERAVLRRERLLRVLNVMHFLPSTFASQIDFDEHPGKFKNHTEPLLPYYIDDAGKSHFIFMDSFREMLADFAQHQPSLVEGGRLVPYDWTIFYLRKKALTQPVSKEELAWILLNFNTKRGYYQLRGMDDGGTESETPGKVEEFRLLKVTAIDDQGPDKKKKGYEWYEITYENGAKQKTCTPQKPHEVGDMVEVIVTTTLDDNGNIKLTKDGEKMIKLRTPKEDDWTLVKKRTEHDLEQCSETVGTYIYEHILSAPDTKVRGRLIQTIERKYYKDELRLILDAQKKFIPELTDDSLYQACIHELYKHNEGHIADIKSNGFTKLFVDDIIFYQRPLKSKKSLIADCPLEHYSYTDEKGNIHTKSIKCIPKSHPDYEEFRQWKFLNNLHIYKRKEIINGKLEMDVDVTAQFLDSEDAWCDLFDWLSQKKDITQAQLLKYPPFKLKKQASEYRWNYIDDDKKAYPCCPTRYEINKRIAAIGEQPLTGEKLQQLWHILYSVDDPVMCHKALRTFALKNDIDCDGFVAAFEHYAPGAKDYGAYSDKAIKRLLPLMRMGRHWSEEAIDGITRQRINHIIDGEVDDSINMRVREKLSGRDSITAFRAMPEYLATYTVYGRHAEANDTTRWETPEDIDLYLSTQLKQHSLRNPIVEKVISETLRLVKDLWQTYGKPAEVHVEMGRDLKKDAKGRSEDTKRIQDNENRNLRIRALLQEFAKPEYDIKDVRPWSPSQQELFKIFEDGVLADPKNEMDDEILTIINDLGRGPSANVSAAKIKKYSLWLEQKYLSPYTGQPIPLSRLFTTDYEIEHVIPQSRYFDDSLTNKVICEKAVNKAKGNMLGYEFIKKQGGSIVDISQGQHVKVLDTAQYEEFVQKHYSQNRTKMRKLLMEDIPEQFIARQMNDTRYMSRKMLSILSCLVREEDEQEATSKHVIATSGAITDRLKKDWGINDVWNHIITPRFERMNEKTESSDFGEWVNTLGKRHFQTNMPIILSKGFSKKRIDHRHHAMDAIVIACSTRNIVSYLNNEAACDKNSTLRYDLRHSLCNKVYDRDGNYKWIFNKPWDTFTQDVESELRGIIVSFKQNLRIVTRATNHYTHYENGHKVVARQTKGDRLAIRKSMHKDTVYGFVNLQQTKTVALKDALDCWKSIKDTAIRNVIKGLVAQYGSFEKKTILKYFKDRDYQVGDKSVKKVEIYYYTGTDEQTCAVRKAIDTSFDEKRILTVTDSGIRKIMLAHLAACINAAGKPDPEIAFSPQGIAEMNKNIAALNGGKPHQPIYKVRCKEASDGKFTVGSVGNKAKKYVVADKDTNLFFAVYADESGKRSFASIPLIEAIERTKQKMPPAEPVTADGRHLLFTLSPNDLVMYTDNDGVEHIYKMVSCTGKQCFFVPETWASPIVAKKELGAMNKVEYSLENINIKQNCYKIDVDRLGRIVKVHKQ